VFDPQFSLFIQEDGVVLWYRAIRASRSISSTSESGGREKDGRGRNTRRIVNRGSNMRGEDGVIEKEHLSMFETHTGSQI
jgi:hypothetical protein